MIQQLCRGIHASLLVWFEPSRRSQSQKFYDIPSPAICQDILRRACYGLATGFASGGMSPHLFSHALHPFRLATLLSSLPSQAQQYPHSPPTPSLPSPDRTHVHGLALRSATFLHEPDRITFPSTHSSKLPFSIIVEAK